MKQIQQLENTALAKRVCKEAEERGWPGLHSEVKEICLQIGIQDINKCSKTNIKEAIYFSHYKDMKEELGRSSKMEDVKNEDFRKIQPYFLDKSIENTRMAFKIRIKMVDKIPGNYKNMYKKNKYGPKCSHCTEAIMTQIHCISYPGMGELREGLDLVNMTDMVTYFRRILKERGHK